MPSPLDVEAIQGVYSSHDDDNDDDNDDDDDDDDDNRCFDKWILGCLVGFFYHHHHINIVI